MDPGAATDDRSILVMPMAQQLEVRNRGDDWTGVTSTSERRKLQNRLNQRACRRRKQELEAVRLGSSGYGVDQDAGLSSKPVQHGNSKFGSCGMDNPARRAMIYQLAIQAYREYTSGIPRPTRLPSLVKLNVFNALTRNAAALGPITAEWLLCDAVSRFGRPGPPEPSKELFGSGCPDSLRPTPLQLSIPHRPWVDPFPLPRLRDNILLANMDPEASSEYCLCYDMVELYGTTSSGPDDPLLIVWGEPWDPYGWEASVAFLRKWGWLLRGCNEILESTNQWREGRGERRLCLGDLEERH
ncbi:Fc.00g104600.m01.CDS01 [Cosmosporella sp. VM-42]